MASLRTPRRVRRPSRAGGSLLAVAIVLAACSATPQSQVTSAPATAAATPAPATPSAAATPAATEAPASATPTAPPATPEPTPAAATTPLDATLYFMGYEISLTGASFDPTTSQLRIEGSFKNDALTGANLIYITDGGKTTVTWAGQVTELTMDSSTTLDVVAGDTIQGAFTGTMPQGFVLAESTLTLGLPDQHQSTLALAPGGAATTEMPRTFAVSGSVKIGSMGKVTFSGGQVVDATCSGDPDRIAFGPAKADEQSILLKVVDQGINSSWDTITYSRVKGPDGISSQGTPGGRYMGSLSTFRSDWLCYTVTNPASGRYVLTFTAERTTAKKTFAFTVP